MTWFEYSGLDVRICLPMGPDVNANNNSIKFKLLEATRREHFKSFLYNTKYWLKCSQRAHIRVFLSIVKFTGFHIMRICLPMGPDVNANNNSIKFKLLEANLQEQFKSYKYIE